MMMAVSFERYGRLYYLDPGPYSPTVGTKVLVPTDSGPEVAICMWAPQWVDEDVGGLPVCAGLAGDEHMDRDEHNRAKRAQARVTARRLIRDHELPMKVIGVDFVDKPPVFTVYFSAPHRVDFRALVRDLAVKLRARVELRQIGPRDEARLPTGRAEDVRDSADGAGRSVGHVPGMRIVGRQRFVQRNHVVVRGRRQFRYLA